VRFRFRLEKVLELRRSELDTLKLRMSELESLRLESERQLMIARRERGEYARQCDAPLEGPLTVLDLQSRLRTVTLHQRRVDAMAAALSEAEDAVSHLRESLLDANRRVKALERLREKKLADHVGEIEAQDRKILDDIQGRKGGVGSVGAALPSRILR
jgi:flagellar protein FliJ